MPVYHGNAANLALVSINIVKIFLRCRKFLFLSFFAILSFSIQANCIAFILDHPSVTSSDDCDVVVGCDADTDADVTFDVFRISFSDLSAELQTELKDLIRWCKSTPEDFESLFNNFQLI